MFVLTGSTRHDSLPRAAQSLTGRLTRLSVIPNDADEVDFVVALDNGGVVGFEIKTGNRVPGEQLKP